MIQWTYSQPVIEIVGGIEGRWDANRVYVIDDVAGTGIPPTSHTARGAQTTN